MNRLFKNIIPVLFFVAIFQTPVFSHDIALPVIIDTDMALDDIRAITMLLNSEVVQIPVIIASDGVRSPEDGIKNLKALLNYFNRSDITAVKGKGLKKKAPNVRSYIKEIRIPGSSEIKGMHEDKSTAPEVIITKIKSMDEPVIYLCMGPLTNLAEALMTAPEIKNKISFLVYYGASPDDNDPGWNSLRDTDAARSVFSSGLKIYSVTLPEEKLLKFNTDLFDRVTGLRTRASGIIEKVHESDDIKKLLNEDHFYIWDEMTAIYFNDSSLFNFSPSKDNEKVMVLTEIDREGIENAYLLALGLPGDYHLSQRTLVIFSDIPKNPSLFREDVRPIVNQVIDVYGVEEWKACLLTNEFHRHLGIYSLVGAKMGVRAREILEAPFDTLEVISNAGNKPPTSCMNDGLQVSTGASLGRGTIRVPEGKPSPSAIFVYNDISLTLSLKKEVWDKIKRDIRRLVEKHGGMNKAYFKDVRELSIQYWLDLDRYEIFDEQVKKMLPGDR